MSASPPAEAGADNRRSEMGTLMSRIRTGKLSRLAPAIAAIGIAAMLSGCVVYPGGHPGYFHHYYWR
jgi:hypothetical protein